MASNLQDLSFLGSVNDQNELLKQQLQLALRRGQPANVQYTTPWAAALGGLSDLLRGVKGGMDTDAIQQQQQDLFQRAADARSAALRGPAPASTKPVSPEVASALGIEPSGYNVSQIVASIRDRTPQAQADAEREQDKAFMMSGDPQLVQFAKARIEQRKELMQERKELREEQAQNRSQTETERWHRAMEAQPPPGIAVGDKLLVQDRRTGAYSPAKMASGETVIRDNPEMNRNVEALSKRLENVPSMRSDLAKLIPYIHKSSIPGVGRVESALPVFGDEAIVVRQAARGLVGALIKEQSGTTASQDEVNRKLEELGMGKFGSEQEFKAGAKRLIENLYQTVKSKESGYTAEALQTFRQRGGTTSDDLKPLVEQADQAKPASLEDRINQLAQMGLSRSAIEAQLVEEGWIK